MSWTCPGHYKVHVYGRDSPGRPVHGHCPVPLPALPIGTQNHKYIWAFCSRKIRNSKKK